MHPERVAREVSLCVWCCADGSTNFEIGALDVVVGAAHGGRSAFCPPRPKVSSRVRADCVCLATDLWSNPSSMARIPNIYPDGWSTTTR